MASRTQLVCLCEGAKGRSIDPVFINTLLRKLQPSWIRPWKGSNLVRIIPCAGWAELIQRTPSELRACLAKGGDTTLMVWADLDHDHEHGDSLKAEFWKAADAQGLTKEEFEKPVFVFAKDRLENWIEYLLHGSTDEAVEGPRIKHNREAADAAKLLAERCLQQVTTPPMPPSLAWSCKNWSDLKQRMKAS